MGDQSFPHKKYSTPRHPWEKERISQERDIVRKYGLKNKRELWKGQAILDSFRTQARDLQARMRYNDPNATLQYQNMIKRLARFNLLNENATLDDVLSLTIEDVLERRFQTVVVRKNLANTMKQSRQLITHGHVTLDGRRTTIPSILVEGKYEESIIYSPDSVLQDEMHPIRQVLLGEKPEEEEPEEEEAKEREVKKPPRAPQKGKPEPRSKERAPAKDETPKKNETPKKEEGPKEVKKEEKAEVKKEEGGKTEK